MRIFLIGHRGTGKTSLLQRLQIYGRGGFTVVDLDREIEKDHGQTVADIFLKQGEAAFRQLEIQTLEKLIERHKVMVCALGAGFPLDQFVFPDSSELVWVRRTSDSIGRIFLDRPRLDPQVDPLTEYRERRVSRDRTFRQHADWVYWLPEGLTAPCEFERKIWGDRLDDCGGILTLRQEHFRSPRVLRDRIAKMGVDYFELRNDLLTVDELRMARHLITPDRMLISVRRGELTEEWKELLDEAAEVDWALELGPPPPARVTCLSFHGQNWEQVGGQPRVVGHLKWSPVIETFAELSEGLRWQQADPERRSFLPRSSTGRWGWARLLLKDRQKFNFFRDGDGSAPDQPTLHEWIRAHSRPTQFAAVLGDPIWHSYSPMEHLSYARHRQMGFYAIQIQEEEWVDAWPVLREWGLQLAAVTSPLKKHAFEVSNEKSPESLALGSANTLTIREDRVRAHNTDLEGMQELLEVAGELGSTIVWGGGGTLAVIRHLVPHAQAVSVRSGQLREPGPPLTTQPDTLIWAASPEAPEPADWKPRLVLDLNYRDDSRARDYAQRVGARYLSGLLMFRTQAAAQREEWEHHGQ